MKRISTNWIVVVGLAVILTAWPVSAQAPSCEDERRALTFLVQQITAARNTLEFLLAQERGRLQTALDDVQRLRTDNDALKVRKDP